MKVLTRKFLNSLGIKDVGDYGDLEVASVSRDLLEKNLVHVDVFKKEPWGREEGDYALLKAFFDGLSSLKWGCQVSFTYGSKPLNTDADELYHEMIGIDRRTPLFGSFPDPKTGRFVLVEPLDPSEEADASFEETKALFGAIGYGDLVEIVASEDFQPDPGDYPEAQQDAEAPKEPEEPPVAGMPEAAEEEAPEDDPDENPVADEFENEPYPDEEAEPADDGLAEEPAGLADEKRKAEKEYIRTVEAGRYSTRSGRYKKVASIHDLMGMLDMNVEFEGEIFEADVRTSRSGKQIGVFGIGDDSDAINLRLVEGNRDSNITGEDIESIRVGGRYRVRGSLGADKYTGAKTVFGRFVEPLPPKPLREDHEPVKRVELHLHTKMSAMDGVGEMSDYVALAKNMGMTAIAVTDHGDIQSFPACQAACEKAGIKPIYGCEFYMFDPHPDYVFNPSPVPLANAKYCVLDLETTGLSSEFDRITEFGGVIMHNGSVIDRLEMMINPGIKIPKKISEKTRITDDMVKDAPTIEQALPKIMDFIGDCILVTHNATFDIGFLDVARRRMGLEPIKNPIIDTLALSRYLFPERRIHRLGNFIRYLGLDDTYNDDDAHRADYDAETLGAAWAVALNKLNPDGKRTHEDLAHLDFDRSSIPNSKGMTDQEVETELAKLRSSYYKNLRPNHIIALVKNAEGLREMYRLVSLSNTDYLADVPKIPKGELAKNRQNLLLGSACFHGEVYDTAIYRPYDELKKVISFYDYIELQPLENYSYLINMGDTDKERLLLVLNQIVKAADEVGVPVVATGDCHYVNPEDKIIRDVYIVTKAVGGGSHPMFPPARRRDKVTDERKMPYFENPDQHFRSTEEMLRCFEEWLPKEKAYEMVVTNSNKIADQIEVVYPVKKGIYPPNSNLPNSAEMLRSICYENLYKTYGPNPDPKIKERLDKELDGIIGHGYSVTYYIANRIIAKAHEDGYLVGSRGSVGSSFAATMANITEVNPLPPHYLCPKCKHFEWGDETKYQSGFDLPDKACPECGTKMEKNGQSIPFETFLGFNAEKVPDIDLNFPQDYQSKAHDYTRQLLGAKNVFRAGTIETVADKTAFGYVRGYFEDLLGKEGAKGVSNERIAQLAAKCQGVKRTTGQHPGGIVVIPSDMDVFDFTPYQHPADDLTSDWLTTHYDFASMHDEVLKLDLLGHVDPMALRKLSLITGVDITKIPMDDKRVLSLFSSPKELGMKANPLNFATGAVALPEFGTNFVQGLLADAKPKTFNHLLIVSGLSHGTNVWNSNAQDLIKRGITDINGVIGCRDDIMNYLISKGVPNLTAFKIMEDVRHGRKVRPEYEKAMRDAGVPDYYIESCNKIKYLFPRAHATAYVMGAVRQAWFKLYRPLDFYAVYFSVRIDKFDIPTLLAGKKAVYAKIAEFTKRNEDRSLGRPLEEKEKEILKGLFAASEMLERGYTFKNIDIYKSEAADFVPDYENKCLILPFNTVDGLGEAAAQTVIEARKEGEFLSKEDLHDRTKLSEANINDLSKLGCLDGMGETNQMSLFEF
jgi:DNA polymerase-3 subunit alpha (Gram-positive type)